MWGDVRETLACLTPRVREKASRRFLDSMLQRHARALDGAVSAYTRNVDTHTPVHPEYVASVLDEEAADDAVFTVDTGMCCVWAARYLTPNGRRRVLGSFVHGSMANALPQAIGAQFLDRGRQVVSMSGDGGFSMLMGDFLTLVQYELPVKVVVFNNSSLGMVDLEMMVDGLPPHGTSYPHTDYAAIARAAGARGSGWSSRPRCVTRCARPSGTRARPWSTWSPTPTRSPFRPGSPPSSSPGSPCPPAAPSSTAASDAWCSWPAPTCAIFPESDVT